MVEHDVGPQAVSALYMISIPPHLYIQAELEGRHHIQMSHMTCDMLAWQHAGPTFISPHNTLGVVVKPLWSGRDHLQLVPSLGKTAK